MELYILTTFAELFEHYLAHPGDYEIHRLTIAEKLDQMLITLGSLDIDLDNHRIYNFELNRVLLFITRPNRLIVCDAETGEIMAEYDSELERLYTSAELEEPYHNPTVLNYGELKIVHK